MRLPWSPHAKSFPVLLEYDTVPQMRLIQEVEPALYRLLVSARGLNAHAPRLHQLLDDIDYHRDA